MSQRSKIWDTLTFKKFSKFSTQSLKISPIIVNGAFIVHFRNKQNDEFIGNGILEWKNKDGNLKQGLKIKQKLERTMLVEIQTYRIIKVEVI